MINFALGLPLLLHHSIKNWKKLEKIPVTKWLKAGREPIPLIKYGCHYYRAKLGDSYTKTSAVFIWATIQRLYGARRSGLKKEMFGFVPGGYKRVIEALNKNLLQRELKLKPIMLQQKLNRRNNRKAQISFTDGRVEEFDEVIATLPSGLSAKLCNGLAAAEMQKLNNIEYLGVICVAVLLDKSISQFYVTNITDSWVPFTGVIEMCALVDKKYFNDNAFGLSYQSM